MIWSKRHKYTNDKYGWLLILVTGVVAIIVSFGLNIEPGTIVSNQGPEIQSVITDFSNAFSADMISSSIEAIFLWVMLVIMIKTGLKKRFIKWWIPFSVLIAICIIFADEFRKNATWDFLFIGPKESIRTIFIIISYSVLVFLVLYALKEIYKKSCIVLKKNKINALEYNNSKSILSMRVFFIILACWLPYYIVFFPGNSFQDTVTQLMQAFHLPSITAGISLTDGINTFYSDHHPVFLTILYGSFARLGILLSGNIKLGIGLYTLFQMIFMAFIMTLSVRMSGKMGVSLELQKFLVFVYSICPFFALNSIGVVKDTILALSVLIITELLLYAVQNRGEPFHNWRYNAVLFAGLLLLMLSKKTGLYIAAVSMICFCISYRKRFIFVMIPFLTSILTYCILFSVVIFPKMNVENGGKQEMLGPLFQHTARYVRDYPEDVTDWEQTAIDGVLDYEKLGDLYNSLTTDPVKAVFKQTAGTKDLKEYFKVYISQFFKHPDAYIQAFFSNMCFFFYLDGTNVLGYTSWMNISDCRKDFLEEQGIYKEDYKELEFTKADWQIKFALVYTGLIELLEITPVLGLFFRKAGIVYLTMMLLLAMMYRRNKLVLGMIPIFVCFLFLFVSPVGDTRYTYPLFVSLPIMIVHVLTKPVETRAD